MTTTPNTNRQQQWSSTSRIVKYWIEAMRLRTLPVSVAGVIMATFLTVSNGVFQWLPTTICLIFAILAQIASNFANEYFDFRDGLDRKGRVGPRRGVTEGDISPTAMRNAALGTLAIDAIAGCTLIYWGGWWLIIAGVLIILGALAYSAGPYPLSRHGLGEVAVVIFFGVAPVTLTYYLQALTIPTHVWLASIATGLMGANVLIVNNYRDCEDDTAVNKRTLAVIFGKTFASSLYLANGIIAILLMFPILNACTPCIVIAAIYLVVHTILWHKLRTLPRAALNPLLGKTSVAMFGVALLLLLTAIILT